MVDKKVSIYQAEIDYKYKVNENQLTSRVFGALAMLPKDAVLLPFLRKLAKGSTPLDEKDPVLTEIETWESEDVEPAKILLWEYVDNTCPDIFITTPSTLIVIEAKTDTKPNKEQQLKPQFIEASKEAEGTKRKLAYFLLTRDDERQVAREAQDDLKQEFCRDARIHWRCWTQVWQWLRDIRKGLQGKTGIENLLDATVKLLEARHMNIKGPTGFKQEWFHKDVINALDKVEELCSEISTTINEVISKARLEGIEVMGGTPHPKSITRKLDNSADWIPRNFEFYFKDGKWEKVEDPWDDPSLLISFCLEAGSAGVSVNFYWNHHLEENMINEIKEHAELEGYDFEYLDEELYVCNYGDSELVVMEKGEQAVKILVEKLDEMRNFANRLETLREALGHKIPRKRAK